MDISVIVGIIGSLTEEASCADGIMLSGAAFFLDRTSPCAPLQNPLCVYALHDCRSRINENYLGPRRF